MTKKIKEADMNLYYMDYGQVQEQGKKSNEAKKKAKERQKRIKQNKIRQEDDFDLGTETVIQMTNKNKRKKEEEQRRRLTQEERKRKKRNKKIKILLKMILLLGIIIGGIAFAMISPIFNIKEVQILGNEQVSAETIISLSELKT